MKKKTAMPIRILAALLLLASAAMLFLPWMRMDLLSGGTSIEIDTLLAQKQVDRNTAVQSITQELLTSGAISAEEYAKLTAGMDLTALQSFANHALEMKWSPFTLFLMSGEMKDFAESTMNYLKTSADQAEAAYGANDSMVISIRNQIQSLESTISGMNLLHIIFMAVLILTGVLALIALLCALTGKKWGMLPYVLLAIVLLAAVFLMLNAVNDEMQKNSLELSNAISDLGKQGSSVQPAADAAAAAVNGFGVRLELELFGILCAALALLSFLVMLLPIYKKAAVPAAGPARVAAPAEGGWKCPACGTVLRADQRFCLRCGAKRPEAAPARAAAPAAAASPAAGGWKCANCGTVLTAEQKFCLRCGAKRPEAAPVRAAAPAAPAAPAAGGWKCPNCGTVLTAEQKFCLRCGAKRPEAAPARPAAPVPPARPAAPAFGGWKCPTCGASLKASEKFCSRCGTKQPAPAAAAPAVESAKCPACGAALKASEKFCSRCGTKRPEAAPAPAEKRCAVCGTVLGPGEKFCSKCGSPAAAAAAAPAPEKEYVPAHAAPEKEYVPAHAAPEKPDPLMMSSKKPVESGFTTPAGDELDTEEKIAPKLSETPAAPAEPEISAPVPAEKPAPEMPAEPEPEEKTMPAYKAPPVPAPEAAREPAPAFGGFKAPDDDDL